MNYRKLSTAIRIGLICAALGNGMAIAADEKSSDLDTVVVTGTRIGRDAAFESPVPMVTVDASAINDNGFTAVGDVLFNLPQAAVNFGAQGTASLFQPGQSRVDLRGLDSNRTLVLVDGRRLISGDFRSPGSDLNLLPSSMIERIDVISGGASAVYGSEAIAGVVNIITRKDQDGLILDIQGGVSQEQDGEEFKLSLSYGGSFLSGRGKYSIGGEYQETGKIEQVDRDWAYPGIRRNTSVSPQTIIPASRSNLMPTATFQLQTNNSVSIALDRSALLTNSQPCRTANVTIFCQDPWLFYIPTYNLLQSPVDRGSLRGYLEFEINDNLSLFGDAIYSVVDGLGVQSPAFSSATSTTMPVRLYGDNPYLTAPATPVAAQLRDAWSAAGLAFVSGTSVPVYKFWEEFGTRDSDVHREMYRLLSGVNGHFQLWNRSFTWETSAQYSETRGRVLGPNNPYRARVPLAVDAILDGGQIVCRNVAARQAGCVPWNIIDGPSPEAVAWTNGTVRYDGLAVQSVFAANITTSLVDLPAGELGLASGIEYRKEFSDFIPDALTSSGVLFATAVPRTRGEFNVKEAYVETVVPLLADVPEAYRMSIEAAVRLADYSSAGTVDQWRLQFTWSLVPEATFRASLASAVRAPDIVESYGPRGSGNTSSALDPCDRAQITAAASNPTLQATRIANCASVIPGYDPATFQSNAGIGSIPTITGSNDKLFEERAETLSVGMVFEPHWLDRLKFSIDYWRIELEDAITTVPVNTLLSTLCYDATEPVAGNRFCDAIHRNLNPGQASTGHISLIELINQNAQAINTAGFDFALSFAQPAGNVGEFDFRLDATKTIRWDLIGFPGAAVAQQVGTLTSGIPEYKAQGALGWRRGPLYAQWQTRFQDSYAISSVDPPASRDPFYTGNYFQHDLNANYQWTDSFGTRMGILNITNEHPPLLPEVGNATDTNSSATYDNRGRWFYLGFNFSFGAAN